MVANISPNTLESVSKSSFSEAVGTVGNAFKTAFVWVVDKVKLVATTVFNFARDTALPFVKNAAVKTVAFLRTNAGVAVAGALGTAGLLYTASKVDQESKVLKAGLYIAAAATGALTVTATVFGFRSGWNVNIV